MAGRRQGLSKYQRPLPLLAVVGDKPRKMHDNVNIDDPPISSDDDQDSAEKSWQTCPETDAPDAQISADEERSPPSYQRGGIKPSTFGFPSQGVERQKKSALCNAGDLYAPSKKRQRFDEKAEMGNRRDKKTENAHTDDITAELPFPFKRPRFTRTYGESKSKRANPRIKIPKPIATSPIKRSPAKSLVVPPFLSLQEEMTRAENKSRTSIVRPAHEPSSPCRPIFKIPPELSEIEPRTGGDGKLEDPTVVSDDEAENTPVTSPIASLPNDEPEDAKCPWCGDVVEKELLDNFFGGKHMKVQMQMRFCRIHKKHMALKTWESRGYPNIDWKTLVGRFAVHRRFLLNIIDGKESFFRVIQAHKIATGQARTAIKEGNLTPGYYGPRGFDIMCDYLGEEYKQELRDRAQRDRVIAGRGVAAFVQTVLVAELAVQLIKDDMSVSEKEARKILEESKALGDLVHTES